MTCARALLVLSLPLLLAPTPLRADAPPAPPDVGAPAAPDPFPTRGWPVSDPARAGLSAPALAALEAYLFPPPRPDRGGVRTDAVLLIHHRALVYERYANGYGPTSRHYGWSMTKSLINALIGVAEAEGRLRRSDPVDAIDPRLRRPNLAGLTVDHLLHLSSGLAWEETYEYSPLRSSVLAMLYTAGAADMAAFVAGFPRAFPPGAHFRYSSGDTNLLASLLKARLPRAEHDAFPFTRLFQPLGMDSAVLEQDQSGTFVGSSYWYATARDFAKFGFLFLNNGAWAGRQLLPPDWVAYSTRVAAAFAGTPPPDHDPADVPGALWWLNRGAPWPGVPEDAYAARGHWGQSIVVIPSLDLVAVRLGDDRDGTFKIDEYLRRLLAALPKQVKP